MVAERLVWTPADGSPDIDLTDEGSGYVWQADGTRGLRSVGYAFTAQSYAGIDGDEVQDVRAEANHPSIGLLVRAGSPAEFRARCRALVHAMRPKAGPGQLTLTADDGSSRHLVCYYESGAEGDESDDTTMPGRWWKLILKFYAPKPWWRGEERTVSIGLGAGTNFFPIFPLVLAPSTVQGQFTVDLSDADDRSYPTWTITGPGSNLVLTNQTTDYTTGQAVEVTQTIEVTASLSAGQSMIIDTRPGYQSVRRDDGTNLMGSVTSDPALWSLVEGVNKVTAALTGATSASRIEGSYQPRYAGA